MRRTERMTRRIARLLGLRLEIAGSVQQGSRLHQTGTNRDRRFIGERSERATSSLTRRRAIKATPQYQKWARRLSSSDMDKSRGEFHPSAMRGKLNQEG